MKKTVIISIAILSMSAVACQEEFRGQYPIDGIAPGQVTNIKVDNKPGGSVLHYTCPEDTDLLYIEAVFERKGRKIHQKSSNFKDSLVIEGLGRAKRQLIELYCVDRSQNYSEPVYVTIDPYDSPIYDVIRTLDVVEDFGGIRLTWENPTASGIMVGVIARSDDGKELNFADNFSSSLEKDVKNVRGFDDKEREFGIFVHDSWDNFTDTLFVTKTPLLEIQLDKKLFKRWNPAGIPYIQGWPTNGVEVWPIEYLWDGRTDGTRGYSPNDRKGNSPMYFTFDLGVTARLSRFVLHQREEQHLCYTHDHPKKFKLYGTTDPNSVNSDRQTWNFIGEYESIQPSGEGASKCTLDDLEYCHVQGESWTVDSNSPVVRYILFDCSETWGGSQEICIQEFTAYGQTVE